MQTILTIFLFFIAFTLIILVLSQPDKSHGMSAGMGGSSSSVFGISKDGGPVAKATKIVAFLFVITGLIIYLIS